MTRPAPTDSRLVCQLVHTLHYAAPLKLRKIQPKRDWAEDRSEPSSFFDNMSPNDSNIIHTFHRLLNITVTYKHFFPVLTSGSSLAYLLSVWCHAITMRRGAFPSSIVILLGNHHGNPILPRTNLSLRLPSARHVTKQPMFDNGALATEESDTVRRLPVCADIERAPWRHDRGAAGTLFCALFVVDFQRKLPTMA